MGYSVELQAIGQGIANYTWYPATDLSCVYCDTPTFSGNFSNVYCVIGLDSFNCADTDCVTINVDGDCGRIACPSAFSPNGDGKNDNFKPLTVCILSYDFRIYNRWGNLQFQTTDLNASWDGKYKGENAPNEVYQWIINAITAGGKVLQIQGDVTLFR